MREVLRIVYPGKQTVNRLTCQRIARRRGPSAGRGWGGGWKPKLRPSYSFIVVYLLLLLSFFIFSFFFFSILMASFFFMSPAAHRTWRPYYCRREFLLSPARVFLYYSPGWMDRQRELFLNGDPRGWRQMQMAADVCLPVTRAFGWSYYFREIFGLARARARTGGRKREWQKLSALPLTRTARRTRA